MGLHFEGDPCIKTRYRIAPIAKDHTSLREGMKSLLSSQPDFEIVGEAEDGRKAVEHAEKFRPDLMLTDLSMPRMNGMEAISGDQEGLSEDQGLGFGGTRCGRIYSRHFSDGSGRLCLERRHLGRIGDGDQDGSCWKTLCQPRGFGQGD